MYYKKAIDEIFVYTWMSGLKDTHVSVVHGKPLGVFRMVHHKRPWQYLS